MIVFCEDCGGKNQLTDQSKDAGRLVFRCTICGYPNNYAVFGPSASPEKESKNERVPLVDAICRLPEVEGAFIFSPVKGLAAFNMPSHFSPKRITVLGKRLVQTYALPRQAYTNVRDMLLVTEGRAVLVKPWQGGRFLVVVGERFPLSSRTMEELNRMIASKKYG